MPRLHVLASLVAVVMPLAGCVIPGQGGDDAHSYSVLLAPEADPPRFVTLTEENVTEKPLQRLLSEVRKAGGEPAHYPATAEEAAVIWDALQARWRAKYGEAPATLVVQVEPWHYTVRTAV